VDRRGFAYRRYLAVLALTSLLATYYALSDLLIQHVQMYSMLVNALSYFPFTAVSWAVARYLRHVNQLLDASRAEQLSQAEALATERERARHARALHDRVLQTMEVIAALTGAAHEALTNVAKHAGVGTATMRIGLSEDTLVLSVLDHGCGFDPKTARQGIGLRESIQGRMAEVGGTAAIDSSPGGGTYVELAVPIRP